MAGNRETRKQKFRPGTLDDVEVLGRRVAARARRTREANTATGSQSYGTTGKVRKLEDVTLGGYGRRIDALESDVATLTGRLDDAAEQAATATANAADALRRVEALGKRVQALEARVGVLEGGKA